MNSNQIIQFAETVQDQFAKEDLHYIAYQVRNNQINEQTATNKVLKIKMEWL